MVHPSEFVEVLNENRLGPFIGVPCSILAPLINYVLDNFDDSEYFNPSNEAHALGVAGGFYLGTGRIPIVFLQNSGFGNIINPLTSLNQIYKLPVLLLITWRGFGGSDAYAPEHGIMGRDLEDYLKAFNLSYEVLSEADYPTQIKRLSQTASSQEIPVAAVVKRDFFDDCKPSIETKTGNGLQRYQAIKIIKESLAGFFFLSTTGFISREAFSTKDSADFYMIGSMGLASAIGCGLALARAEKRIAILDGDGAILMHLGLIPFIGNRKPRNLLHFILDNQAYASTQNQPTISPTVEFDRIALASGYHEAYKASSGEELKSLLESIRDSEGPILVWVKVASGNQSETGRISYSPEAIKRRFIEKIRGVKSDEQ